MHSAYVRNAAAAAGALEAYPTGPRASFACGPPAGLVTLILEQPPERPF